MNDGRLIDLLPERPVISRFVAPWDTSGWYYAMPNFGVGSRLYANAEVTAAVVPECIAGGDHIVTYDSWREGFDDKQGVAFYCERECLVHIALEARADDSFLHGFARTGACLTASDGCAYALYHRRFSSGEEVRLPGFSGDCPHYIVIIRAEDDDACQAAPELPKVVSRQKAHVRPDVKWYVHTVFADEHPGEPPRHFVGHGAVIDACGEARRRIRLSGGARVRHEARTTGCDITETELVVSEGSAVVACCGASITLAPGGAVLGDGRSVGDDLKDDFSLRFLRHGSLCEIWLNSRVAGVLPARPGEAYGFSVSLSSDARAWMPRFSLRDRTDLPLAEETCEGASPELFVSDGALFEQDTFGSASLRLPGDAFAIRTFAPVSGTVRLETTVRPSGDAFTVLLEARDGEGRTAMRCAMYKNNLFASDGRRWRRIFGGHISGMYYPHANWYRLCVVIDLEKQTYDLRIDGARRVRGFALAARIREIAQAACRTTEDMLRLRGLRVYDRASPSDMPLPPAPVFDVLQAPYLARGDGVTSDTEAVQRAIDDAAACAGTVLLRRGIFRTGELLLRSDVTLWIAREATLLGTQNHDCYPLRTPCASLCAHRQLGRGILYGEGLRNVRITGGGTIDANGNYRFKMNDPINSRERDARPDQIYIACSEHIVIENLSIVNSAFWSVVTLSCRNVLIERVCVDAMNTPNRDGIDPVDCTDMTVRACCIIAGDDGLCFKSSDSVGCRNIDVSDIVIQSLASGIKFGTDSYHSLVNVHIRDGILKNINRCGVSLESVDGAAIERVCISHLDISDTGAPLYIVVGVRNRLPHGAFPERSGYIRGVRFDHIRYEQPYRYSHVLAPLHEIMVIGEDETHAIRDLCFEHCHLILPGGVLEKPDAPRALGHRYPEYDQHGISAGYAFTLRHACDVRFTDCVVELEKRDVRPMIAEFACARVISS